MATVEALMTAEEFAAMPDTGVRTELVLGRIIEMPPPKPLHGLVCLQIARLLGNHVADRGLGRVLTNDSGVITHRNPDSLRGADVAFYAAAKLPPIDQWTGYFAFPPDLVVEVRSPSDRWTEVLDKVVEYLAAGVRVVAVLDPELRSAHVFEADRAPRIPGPDDTLTFPDLLSDFAVVVGRIFD